MAIGVGVRGFVSIFLASIQVIDGRFPGYSNGFSENYQLDKLPLLSH